MSLLPVSDAIAKVLEGVEPVETEVVPLLAAVDRILAEPIMARRAQSPFPASAMDGYAVRGSDVESDGARLRVVGEAAAGRSYGAVVGPGEAVRIFTGAPVPEGADTILVQEFADRSGDSLIARSSPAVGRHVRPAGLDFSQGDVLLEPGRRLDGRALSLAAAANYPELTIRRRPKVAILATGDELVEPGTTPGPDQIVASNQIGLAAEVLRAGGEPLHLGIARDDQAEIASAIANAVHQKADVIVTLGGASVGEHDLVAASLDDVGMDLGFWKIAMRPGKPLIFGRIGTARVLGLPGNPVSSLVCSVLFLRPLVAALLGTPYVQETVTARLTTGLPENDQRQDYLRSVLTNSTNDMPTVTPFGKQDSSMLAVHARANALVVRVPFAPPARAGDSCTVLPLD